MKIVTGHTGQPHVTSDDMSALQRGIVGLDDYVVKSGHEFVAQAVDGNTIQMPSGEVVIQGTHCRLEGNERASIDAGTTGTYRCDLIVIRYNKDENDIESCELDVVKGSATNKTGVIPGLEQNDIRSGGSVREVALFAVQLNGALIESITRVIPVADTLVELKKSSDENAKNISAFSKTIESFKLTINSCVEAVKSIQSKLEFSGALTSVSTYAKAKFMSWVASNTAAGNPDVLGAGIFVQNSKGEDQASFRVFSNGRMTLRKNTSGSYTDHAIPLPKWGKVTIDVKKKDTPYYKVVKFGVTYAEAPVVVCTANSQLPGKVDVSVRDITTTQCKVYIERDTIASTVVNWVAFGKLPK